MANILIKNFIFRFFIVAYQAIMRLIKKNRKRLYKIKKSRIFLYTIVEIRYKKSSKKYILIVQVNAKNIFFEITPYEIFKNEVLISGFSPADICAICFMLQEEKYRPQYKIMSQHFSSAEKSEVFVFSDKGMNNLIALSALDVLKDPSFIEKVSQFDAYKIGYSIGEMTCAQK